MKGLQGLLALAVIVSLVSAKPLELDFGARGINLDKVLANREGKELLGDIWSNCGSADDIGKIGGVSVSPDPPKKGADLTVDANVTISEQVTKGSIAVKLQYFVLGIPVTVVDDTLEICSTDTGLTCPLDAGEHDIKFSREIPGNSPGGKYKGNAVATSSNGKRIICIDLEFNL